MDDVLAIVFALASPEVKLEALTLVFGNTDLHYTVSNIKRLAGVLQTHFEHGSTKVRELFNHSLSQDSPTIPVYEGADQPVSGKAFTASYLLVVSAAFPSSSVCQPDLCFFFFSATAETAYLQYLSSRGTHFQKPRLIPSA